jgi:hypothetical protein
MYVSTAHSYYLSIKHVPFQGLSAEDTSLMLRMSMSESSKLPKMREQLEGLLGPGGTLLMDLEAEEDLDLTPTGLGEKMCHGMDGNYYTVGNTGATTYLQQPQNIRSLVGNADFGIRTASQGR